MKYIKSRWRLSTVRVASRLSRIFRDNLSRIFTRPPKTLGEKYFRAGPKPVETFRPSRPGLRPRQKPTTRGLLRSRNDAGEARFDGRTVFQLTVRWISVAVSPVTAPRPRRFARRAVPAPSDTKRSASRKATKTRVLPSSATTGDVKQLRPRRETRTRAGRAPSREVCADAP